MPCKPITVMAANQINMTGPNILPMLAVPRGCSANNATSTNTVAGSTYGSNAGIARWRPSSAESTEIAGVIAPSP